MAPSSWTTQEQRTFLKEQLPEYLTHSDDKDYYHFWPALFSAWFSRWPERSAAFPSIQGPLTTEQETALGKAIEKRKNQLRTWYRWRANSSRTVCTRKNTKSAFDEAIEGKNGRNLSEPELYYDLYFDERIKPLVDADRQEGRIKSKGEILVAGRAHAKRLLKKESDDVKAKIREMYLLQNENKKDDENADDLEKRVDALLRGINDLPRGLVRAAELIKERTGYATYFICAGPDPSRNWEIASLSYHSDKTTAGYTFASLYPKQVEESLKAFQEFAEQVFPPETRGKQRATQTDIVSGSGDAESGFGLDLLSDGGVPVSDDMAVSSSGVEDGLDTDQAPDDSEFTEPEEIPDESEFTEPDDGAEQGEAEVNEWGTDDAEEGTSDPGMGFNASDSAEVDASFHSVNESCEVGPTVDASLTGFQAHASTSMGLDFGMIGGFDGLNNSSSGLSLALPGSALPGFSLDATSNIHALQLETFSGGLAAPTSFDYSLASSNLSYPTGNVMPDFSFSGLLDSSWDFTGIDLNTFDVPISEERSTSPRKRRMRAFDNPTDQFTLPILPMPPNMPETTASSCTLSTHPAPSAATGPIPDPESSRRLHALATIHDPAASTHPFLPMEVPQGTSVKTVVSHSPGTHPTPSAAIRPTPDLASSRRGPQKSAVKTRPQERKKTRQAIPATILQEAAPRTQTPPAEPEPRLPKRVPIKSKRNDIANAIGTNNLTFVDANKAATPSHSVAKRVGDNSIRGEKKKMKTK